MPDNYFARYLPLLIHLLLAAALAGIIVLLSWLIGYRRPTRAKLSPYECGMTPVGNARERFSVKFYLVAMLFILFDVEAIFLYPWAVILRDLKMFGFLEMMVYIGIVLVGLFYIWKKGALDWGKPSARRGEI
jgi:NADH-quinone oxidoreductase subunit A